jgi:hypothetical protein
MKKKRENFKKNPSPFLGDRTEDRKCWDGSTVGCRKRVAPEFSTFHIFPFLPEVFVPGTSRAVQTHFVPSWYKEKWKKWKVRTKLRGDTFPATR